MQVHLKDRTLNYASLGLKFPWNLLTRNVEGRPRIAIPSNPALRFERTFLLSKYNSYAVDLVRSMTESVS